MAGILFLSAVAVSLCALLGIALFSGGIRNSGSRPEYTKVKEWELPAGEIRSLKVEVSFSSVYLCEGKGDTIVIREYANFTPRDGQLSQVMQKGTELRIRGMKKQVFTFLFWGARDAYMEIYLPKELAGRLELLDVGTTSGDVIADTPLQVDGNVSVSTTSGDILLDGLTGNGDFSSTSGDISLDGLTGNGDFSTTSGGITINRLTGDSDMSTTSGDIFLEETEGNMVFDTTSGDISIRDGKGGFRGSTTSGDIWLGQWEGSFSASTTSGSVELKLPKEGSFTLDFDTVSGDCDTFFDDQLNFGKSGRQVSGQYGGGADIIEVSTTSGDLWIGSCEGQDSHFNEK